MSIFYFILNTNFEQLIRVTAIFLVSFSQFNYLYRLFRKQVCPSLITWIGWAVLMGISFIAQFNGWGINNTGLLISILGCFSIALSSFALNHYTIDKNDYTFLLCGLGCILLYLVSSNAWLTTILAIAADLIFAIPTLKSAYKEPEKSRVIYWPIASLSWVFNVWMISYDFNWLQLMWPAYLILFNGIVTYLVYLRQRFIKVRGIL